MATIAASQTERSGLGKTERRDTWWVGPLMTVIILSGFAIYATFRAVYAQDYELGHGARVNKLLTEHAYLLSPFFSPLILLPGMPAWFSPAFLILWVPGGFRLTCYYYRKAYYRSFFGDPPGCGVGEMRGGRYMGETGLFIFQNLHRFFLYLALIFILLLAIDVVHACMWPTDAGGTTFGVSVASIVLAVNVVLLSLYTFSCHSLRHLIGGKIDCFSCVAFGQTRYKLWKGASMLNRNHMLWAWCSLFSVGFADFYVWLVASQTISDVRLF